MPELISLQPAGPACVVTLQRPAALNAISLALEQALCEALASPEVRDAAAVIFTGGADVFSAGADLKELRSYSPAEILARYRETGDFAERVADLPQPTFSAISGYCIGGGLELALATDFRIAARGAEFRFPEVSLGILPSWGGCQRMVRLLGPARAKEVILLRERLDAEAALAIGLVTEVVDGAPLPRALELAQQLSERPRLAVSVTKQVIDSLPEASRTAGLALERLAYAMLAQTPEADSALAGRWSS